MESEKELTLNERVKRLENDLRKDRSPLDQASKLGLSVITGAIVIGSMWFGLDPLVAIGSGFGFLAIVFQLDNLADYKAQVLRKAQVVLETDEMDAPSQTGTNSSMSFLESDPSQS